MWDKFECLSAYDYGWSKPTGRHIGRMKVYRDCSFPAVLWIAVDKIACVQDEERLAAVVTN